MSRQLTDEQQRLLARIARQRRRLDRRAGMLIDHSLLIGSWRTYVEQHPARALLAATGVGMTLSLLLSAGGRHAGELGRRLYDAATGAAWGEMWGELRKLLDQFGDRFPDAAEFSFAADVEDDDG
jgi:hypothetical protein